MTRYDLFRTTQTAGRRRVVLLTYVLPSAYNLGYGNLETLPVARINGRDVDSITDVDEAFQHPDGDFHRIVFEPNPVRAEVVRSEEHTSELQSLAYLVCRLLL